MKYNKCVSDKINFYIDNSILSFPPKLDFLVSKKGRQGTPKEFPAGWLLDNSHSFTQDWISKKRFEQFDMPAIPFLLKDKI